MGHDKLAKLLAIKARELHSLCLVNSKDLQGVYKCWNNNLPLDSFSSFVDAFVQTWTYALFVSKWNIELESRSLTIPQSIAHITSAVPHLRQLFVQVPIDGGVVKCLDEILFTLNSFDLRSLFSEDPLVHFYELFLQEYSRLDRNRNGVFYTPRRVAQKLIYLIDQELISEHSKPLGLASDDIVILEPAMGTGVFIEEVIWFVYDKVRIQWSSEGLTPQIIEQRWKRYVQSFLKRLIGIELMVTPYLVSHLRLYLALRRTGYCLNTEDSIRLLCGNTLEMFIRGELDEVSSTCNVVLGNPPYSGLSQNMQEELTDLIEPYKYISNQHFGERKHWLHDDYVKFFRVAQSWVGTASGVVGLVTNHGFLTNPSFRGMRWNLLQTFQRVRIIDLHGNVMLQEAPPNNEKNENVFAIQQGVCLSVLSRSDNANRCVKYGEVWGTKAEKEKRIHEEIYYHSLSPKGRFFLLVPQQTEELDLYERFIPINDIFERHSTGFITARDSLVIDYSAERLVNKISTLTEDLTSDDIRNRFFSHRKSQKYLPGDSRGWKLEKARELCSQQENLTSSVRKCLYRPFDIRFVFWEKWMIDWPRTAIHSQVDNENLFLIFMRQVATGKNYTHAMVSRFPVEARACYSNKGTLSLAPLYTIIDGKKTSNLKTFFFSESSFLPLQAFHYIVAVLTSNIYRTRFSSFLKLDFPRIPKPFQSNLCLRLSLLGKELVNLFSLSDERLNDTSCVFEGQNKIIEQVRYDKENETLFTNHLSGFRNVSEAVWLYELGGYQVVSKWIGDRRKSKYELTTSDISHFAMMTKAIDLIQDVTTSIDEIIEPLFSNSRN